MDNYPNRNKNLGPTGDDDIQRRYYEKLNNIAVLDRKLERIPPHQIDFGLPRVN